MALIDPKGLFYGERLGECSDDAQLHWPRLFAGSNGFGRIELSYERICDTVYQSFKKKPKLGEVEQWFREYQANFLLFVYESENGALWGQWITSEKFLPKYKTSADHKSPKPNPEALKSYQQRYIEGRKSKYLSFQSFHKSSETSENVPKVSADFLLGVGIGEGDGEGESSCVPNGNSVPKSSSQRRVSAEPEPVRSVPERKVAGTLPTNEGKPFAVFEDQVQSWQATYPAVDVRQELREMRAWADANPTKRKTQRGMLSFITKWLGREQDRGGARNGNGGSESQYERATREARSILGIGAAGDSGPPAGSQG